MYAFGDGRQERDRDPHLSRCVSIRKAAAQHHVEASTVQRIKTGVPLLE
jgi:hypothetical protein